MLFLNGKCIQGKGYIKGSGRFFADVFLDDNMS